MDKLTKEQYREYLKKEHEKHQKIITDDVPHFEPNTFISILKLDLEIMKELYRLDNEKGQ